MERLCPSLLIPCAFLRMLLMAILMGTASAFSGYSVGWSLAFGVGSLLLMQVGYFGALLILLSKQRNGRE